MLDTVFFQVE